MHLRRLSQTDRSNAVRTITLVVNEHGSLLLKDRDLASKSLDPGSLNTNYLKSLQLTRWKARCAQQGQLALATVVLLGALATIRPSETLSLGGTRLH